MGKAQRNRSRTTEAFQRGPGHNARALGVGAKGDVGEQAPHEAVDRYLPAFSVLQADALRGHCVAAVRAHGFRAKDRGSHIVVTGGPFTGAGAQLGFSTIGREALRVPEAEWPALVEAIVGQVLGAAVQGSTARGSLGYTGPALRERLFPRFVAPQRMPDDALTEEYTYARRVGGLPLIMAIRRDQTSMYVADHHLAKAGGLEAAWEAAEQNLFSADLGSGEAFVKDGSAVILLESDHPRHASWLAYPERLMEHFGIEAGPLGVFFTVPALRMITFSEVSEDLTIEGVMSMLELTAILAKDEVAPLSPHLYWWSPGGEVMAATEFDHGVPALTLPKSVMEAIVGEDSGAMEIVCAGRVPGDLRHFDTMDE